MVHVNNRKELLRQRHLSLMVSLKRSIRIRSIMTLMRFGLLSRARQIKLQAKTRALWISHSNSQVYCKIFSLFLWMPGFDSDRSARHYQDFTGGTGHWHWKDHNWDGKKILYRGEDNYPRSDSCQCWYVYFTRAWPCKEMGSWWLEDSWCDNQDRHYGSRYWCF